MGTENHSNFELFTNAEQLSWSSPGKNASWTNRRNPWPGANAQEVAAQPLTMLLDVLNRSIVDFWSLDVEGAEGAILKATDFNRIEVGVLLMEGRNLLARQT